MYKESFLLTVRLFPVVIVAIVAAMASLLLNRVETLWFADTIANFFVWTTFCFFAYFFILFPNKAYSQIKPKMMLGFILINCGFFILYALPALLILLALLPEIEAIANGDQYIFEGITKLSFYSITLFTSLIVFSLLGTYLPAFIYGRGEGIKSAFNRGKRRFFRVAARLIIGPYAVSIVSFVIYAVVLSLLDLMENSFQEDWTPNYFTLLISLPFYWVQAWSVVMASWILSKVFLTFEKNEMEELPIKPASSGAS